MIKPVSFLLDLIWIWYVYICKRFNKRELLNAKQNKKESISKTPSRSYVPKVADFHRLLLCCVLI